MSEQQSFRGQVDRMLGQIVTHGRHLEGWTSEDRQWVIEYPVPALILFAKAVRERDSIREPKPGAVDLLIKDVFTVEKAGQIGSTSNANARVLNLTEERPLGALGPIKTLGELAGYRENVLRHEPNMGDQTISYIKAVLAEHGLSLSSQ